MFSASGARAMTPRTLVTVRPGPVLHVWRAGREVAVVPLELHGALVLAEAILREARAAQGSADQTLRPIEKSEGSAWDERATRGLP
ncbi:hypothetical protein CCR87_11755 [Rhodobaculum claviforme]|uniref:Uncharacterized protein n=2 Tax=Rhodobaculum claviforme TaxID=1549854 RepID=A0A934TMX9_9RHOB|nr:hypothetical protein [Rhodobaculum claviforme]